MSSAVVVLGSPNDESGRLLPIAIARCERALSEYSKIEGCKILCTGGFGAHFNKTLNPHSLYLKNYLMAQGIPENDFLELAVSSFTIEDAELAKPILLRNSIEHIVVVTSDFHMQRAKLIFDKVLSGLAIVYAESATPVTPTEFQRLVRHEKTAIRRDMVVLQR